ncbi:MAG: rubrerythrin family protein [Nitrospiraceae bacterium]|nr:MAG: rubrerythrin family protein [Nitrospiraceae bacterium]
MGDQTLKNLKEAFAGESQANRRYLAFAVKAEEEGFTNLARMFRAIARSETIHAHNHLKNLGAVKSSLENVEEAYQGETDEFSSMYPMFMDQAKRDTNNDALKSFFWANEAEKIHADFFDKALKTLKEGNDVQVADLHICSVCGYTVEGEPPAKCPLCGAGKEAFETIE